MMPKSHFWFSVFLFVFGVFTSPLRVTYNWLTIDYPDLFCTKNNPAKHKEKVKKIIKQIQSWNQNGRKGLLVSSRPSWQKMTITDINKYRLNQIDVNLKDIIDIDEKERVLTVEPRMKMGTLTRKLLARGWTIPVVPELQELTVGGLICGGGIETSSHKYGGFYNTCLSYEVVVADGRVLNCSKTENPLLYYSMPMSYGTLGFLTAVKIPLIPAKKFVKIEYVPVQGVDKAMDLLRDSSHEFVEGIQFDKKKFVVMYGDLTDYAPRDKIRTFSKWWDQLFHFNVETFLDRPHGQVQYIPTRDYYHRYERAIFWIMAQILSLHRYFIFRLLFGWCIPVNVPLTKFVLDIFTIGQSGKLTTWALEKVKYVLQDYLVPIEAVPELLEMAHHDIGIYPRWLCPIMAYEHNGSLVPSPEVAAFGKPKLYVDVGLYGYSTKPISNLKKVWTKYEHYTLEHKGCIGFYSDAYLTREEFDQMFDPTQYLKARKEYGADGAFPLVYDKVSIVARKR